MQLPIDVRAAKGFRLQRQLVDQVQDLISRGILPLGARLPSSREMADQLGISRRTVVLAYERLVSDGLIETRAGLGTFVCNQLPTECIRISSDAFVLDPHRAQLSRSARAVRGMGLYQPPEDRLRYDFRIGRPDACLFPRTQWRRLISDHLDASLRLLSDYTNPAGHPLLRQAIADHLRIARGIVCRPDQVIVTAGIQEGLNLIARLMGVRGRHVIVEDPCYQGAARVFLGDGAMLLPVPVQEDGLDTDRLPACGACLGYVTPSHQFPLGMTLSRERRAALVAWARRTGTLLVEDDYDSDFRYNSAPLVALQAMAPESVVYLGTFSKSIGPGLRLGYAVIPSDLAEAARAIKSVMNNGHSWLEQSAMAQFISSGAFEQHLARMRTCYLERRNVLMECIQSDFPNSVISGYESGMHLVWTLAPNSCTASDLLKVCRRVGVGIYSLRESPTYQLRTRSEGLRQVLLGYPSLTPDQIRAAISLISCQETQMRKQEIVCE